MVKVKKPISVAPSKAAPLKKTIKKKQQQHVENKLSDVKESEQLHAPLVALGKNAKKSQVSGKKVKPIKGTFENAEPVKAEKGKKTAVLEKKSKSTKKSVQNQTNKFNGGKIEKANVNKKKEKKISKKLASEPYANAVEQSIKKVKEQQNKKLTNKSEEKALPPVDLLSTEELPTFDEKTFLSIVNVTNIKKIAKSLKTIVEEEVSKKKNTLFADYRYFLNITSFKIADCPKRMVKLNLKHSLLDKENDDVLIVVPDLQRGAKADYEPTIQHYTDLFRENGVNELGYRLTIMPFNQLRQEHKTFEAKRKLAATYEHYLCDSRVVGHAVGCTGKKFQKPRTTLHAVHLDKNDKLKERIKRGLYRTAYKQLHKGDMISIPVGNHNFTIQQLAENVAYVVEQMKELFPGGYANIRNMHLKIDLTGTSSLPIFISNCAAPTHTPYVVGPREKHLLKLKRDANSVLQKFDLDKHGLIKPLSKKEAAKKQKVIEYRKNMLEVLKNKGNTENDGKPTKKAKIEIKNKIKEAADDNDDDDDEDDNDDENEDNDDQVDDD